MQLVGRDAVGLGSNQQEVAIDVPQPLEQLQIEFLWRDGYVDEYYAQRQRFARLQIGIYELRPLRRDFLRYARIPIARQVGEDEVGLWLAGAAYLKEVNGLGTARRVAGLGDFAADKRINETRLADVGAAYEGDLRRARGRLLSRVGC